MTGRPKHRVPDVGERLLSSDTAFTHDSYGNGSLCGVIKSGVFCCLCTLQYAGSCSWHQRRAFCRIPVGEGDLGIAESVMMLKPLSAPF
jgi:hypothetical protein